MKKVSTCLVVVLVGLCVYVVALRDRPLPAVEQKVAEVPKAASGPSVRVYCVKKDKDIWIEVVGLELSYGKLKPGKHGELLHFRGYSLGGVCNDTLTRVVVHSDGYLSPELRVQVPEGVPVTFHSSAPK